MLCSEHIEILFWKVLHFYDSHAVADTEGGRVPLAPPWAILGGGSPPPEEGGAAPSWETVFGGARPPLRGGGVPPPESLLSKFPIKKFHFCQFQSLIGRSKG